MRAYRQAVRRHTHERCRVRRVLDWFDRLDAADKITVLYAVFFVCLIAAAVVSKNHA